MYIYLYSKLLGPVVCFAELVQGRFGRATSTLNSNSAKTSRIKCTKTREQLRSFCLIYIHISIFPRFVTQVYQSTPKQYFGSMYFLIQQPLYISHATSNLYGTEIEICACLVGITEKKEIWADYEVGFFMFSGVKSKSKYCNALKSCKK